MAFSTTAMLSLDISNFSEIKEDAQIDVIQKLIEFLKVATTDENVNPSDWLWSPAGDGGTLTVFNNNIFPLEIAKKLAKLIRDHNNASSRTIPEFHVRMGLHAGPVTKENDLDNRINVWGPGINYAARVAELAKPDQILASKAFYEQAGLSSNKEITVDSIGQWWVKHNRSIEVYNIRTHDGIGISEKDLDPWFSPFNYPMEIALVRYEAMLKAYAESRDSFRAAVLAKRILDLYPFHKDAKNILQSLSKKRHKRKKGDMLLHPFFTPLSPDAILYFFNNSTFRTHKKNNIVAAEGDPAEDMMMVVSGEIVPEVNGKRILGHSEGDREEEAEISFREGDLIGEMGLFNPSRTRTATLRATTNSNTLSINYHVLEIYQEGDNRSANENEDMKGANKQLTTFQKEIRQQLWEYYCARTIENQFSSHPLLNQLSYREQDILYDVGEFYPREPEGDIKLDFSTLWDRWLFVISGSVRIKLSGKDEWIEYTPGQCIGTIRTIREDCPYKEVKISGENTQLISFPWKTIESLQKNSEKFLHECEIISVKDNRRYK